MPDAAARTLHLPIARLFSALAGLAVAAFLVLDHGWRDVLRALQAAGWAAIGAITLFHALPTLLCGLAWWLVLRAHSDERWPIIAWLRWIRDGTDGLIPIGGEFIATRILSLRGVALGPASLIVDLTAELLAQVMFAALGLVLLMATHPASHYSLWFALGIGLMAVQFGGFLVAQRKGLFRVIDRPLDAIRNRPRSVQSRSDQTLHERVLAIYAHPRAFFGSIVLHLAAWVIGALEVWIGLRFMGRSLDVAETLLLESLVTVIRSITFFVPLGVGIQEGSYVLVGALVGLPADLALAVSLLKRARDVIKGVPALMQWQLVEIRESRRTRADRRLVYPQEEV